MVVSVHMCVFEAIRPVPALAVGPFEVMRLYFARRWHARAGRFNEASSTAAQEAGDHKAGPRRQARRFVKLRRLGCSPEVIYGGCASAGHTQSRNDAGVRTNRDRRRAPVPVHYHAAWPRARSAGAVR